MKKLLFALILPLSIIFVAGASAAAISYEDVSEDAWYYDSVMKCQQTGIMVGYSNQTFNPAGDVTLAELALTIHRLYNYLSNGDATIWSYNPDYLVVPSSEENDWYVTSLTFLANMGIDLNQYASDGFRELAKRRNVVELLLVVLEDVELEDNILGIGASDTQKSDPLFDFVLQLQSAGILLGREDGAIDLEANLGRAELAAICIRTVVATSGQISN